MAENAGADGLLSAEEVASYLGVGAVTVYRWCRQGRLPALKIGRSWRIRRSALQEFLRQREHAPTLAGLLSAFVTVPDHIIAAAATPALLHRLDAAFFQVGEARGGSLVKVYRGETASVDTLRADLTRHGLGVAGLERAGRFRFSPEGDPHAGRAEGIRAMLSAAADEGRALWVSFDWVKEVDMQEAVRQEVLLADLVEANPLVIKTAVLDEVADAWAPAERRRAQASHRGMITITPRTISCSRRIALPPH